MNSAIEPTHEARRVRFDCIDGLQRRDLGMAGEIWLHDICEAKWATRDAMRLAAHLVRYMSAPDARQLAMSRIEHQVQLTREEIQAGLRALRQYRAIEVFSVAGDELRAALYLSATQRLAVLEARYRLEYLTRHFARTEPDETTGARWVPPAALADDGAPHVAERPATSAS